MASDLRRAGIVLVSFGLLGALVGYLFHRLVGCPSGGCPITGNPFVSTIYGFAVGAIAGSRFARPPQRR